MGTLTLTQCATNAALELGVLDSGEGLSTQQLNDFLFNVNNLIDNWSSEQAQILAVLIASYALVADQQKYTIGTGGNFNTNRPVDISAAVHVLTVSGNQYQTPVAILNAKSWSAIPDRGSSSLIVNKLFYDRQFPTGNVYLSPVPATSSGIELTMWQPLSQFADLTTPITMPPGYTDLYVLAGAIAMAPQFDMTPSPALTGRYEDEMSRIRSLNASLLGMSPPAGQSGAAATTGEPTVSGQ